MIWNQFVVIECERYFIVGSFNKLLIYVRQYSFDFSEINDQTTRDSPVLFAKLNFNAIIACTFPRK